MKKTLLLLFIIAQFIFAAEPLQWDFTQGLQGWEVRNGSQVQTSSNGLEFQANGNSVLVSPPLEINANDYDTMEIILSSDKNDVFGFCFGSTAESVIPEYRFNKALQETGTLCLFRQALYSAINWKGTVKTLELYPSAGESLFNIRSVKFYKSDENMLFWGNMNTLINGQPAEWSLSKDAKFMQDTAGNYICLSKGASASCQFASLDTMSSFRLSLESHGKRGEAAICYYGENNQILRTDTLSCTEGDEWHESSLEVTPPDFAWRADITFKNPDDNEFFFKNAKVVSIAAVAQNQEAQPEPQTENQQPAKGRQFPLSQIKMENGVATLFVNGKRMNSIHNWFWNTNTNHMRNSKDIAKLNISAIDLASAGVSMTPNGFDYTIVDGIIDKHFKTCPDTFFFLYFDISGNGNLNWWCDAHPEALCRPEDGSDCVYAYGGGKRKCASMSSELWRSTFEDAIRHLIRHLKASPYASRIIGFNVEAGLSYEWMQYGSQAQQFCDYSQCAVEDFRQFLKKRYADDKALQNAWHNPEVTLETAAIPSSERRKAPANGTYFDPKKEQDILDHNEYQQYLVSHCITRFAKAIKEESDERCLMGAFYGYTNYIHDMVFMCTNCGHADARHILDSPYMDFLIAPVSYNQRRPGAFTQTMIAPWGCNANGKIFFNQVDFRNHHAPQGDYYRTDSLQESASVLYRELARNLAEGNSFQFLDFGSGWTFGDKRLSAVAGKMAELFEKYRWTVKDFERKDYLLVVIDERLMEKFNCYQPPFERELVYNQLTALDAAGIPWRCVLLTDLMKHPELQKYGSYLFLNQFRMDDEIAEFLKKKILTKNRLVSFIGPVGILAPEEISTRYAERLFGRKFKLDTSERDAHCKATKLWAGVNGETWGSKRRQTQAYIMLPEEAENDEIVGRMAGDDVPGALFMQKSNCKIYWSAVASTTPAMLRELARRGNIPVVADENDAHFIGCGFLGIHAHTAGKKTIRLIGKGTPKDILTGQTWPKGTREIQLDMAFGENRIFIME